MGSSKHVRTRRSASLRGQPVPTAASTAAESALKP
jgi:hypothetical protein